MKNFKFCCFILSLSFVQILFAIDPPYDCYQPQNCGSIRHSYKFCNTLTGEICDICVMDPYNINVDELNTKDYPRVEYNFEPMKLSLPICLDFNPITDMPLFSGTGVVEAHICGNGSCGGGTHPVFNSQDVEPDLRKAFNYWNCMCGTQNEHCQCSIKVKFSDNIDNFKNHKSDPTGSSIMNIYEKPGCQFDCEDLVIYINNTHDYVRADNGSTTGYSRILGYFYTTSSIIPQLDVIWQTELRCPKCTNLTKIVANELGKMLGLSSGEENIGEFNCICPVASVMKQNSFKEWDNIQVNPEYDHCAFKKLYCDGGTDVESFEDEKFEVKFINNLLILTNIKEGEVLKRITISDYLGRVLIDKNNPEISNNIIQINMKNFSNTRVFFIKIETENEIITKKIIK